MISVYSRSDLKQFGINPLTGEACKYGMRVLCDLSEKGAELISEFMGLRMRQPTEVFGANWNSKVRDDPAVASFMMPTSLFEQLTVFAMFYTGDCYLVCARKYGAITGYTLEEHDDLIQRYGPNVFSDPEYIVYRNPSKGEGSRNTHAMTGRTY